MQTLPGIAFPGSLSKPFQPLPPSCQHDQHQLPWLCIEAGQEPQPRETPGSAPLDSAPNLVTIRETSVPSRTTQALCALLQAAEHPWPCISKSISQNKGRVKIPLQPLYGTEKIRCWAEPWGEISPGQGYLSDLLLACFATFPVPCLKDYLSDHEAEEQISWETAGDGEASIMKKSEQS